MEHYPEILLRCPLFAGVDGARLGELLDCLRARVLPCEKNRTVIAAGDPAGTVGIVLSGAVQILRVDYYGNRSIVERIGPGQLFGESFAYAAAPHMPVSVAATESGAVLLLDSRRLAMPCCKACDFHTAIAENLLKVMAGRNLLLHRKLEILSRRSTRERLMAYLLAMATDGGSDRFTVPFDRQALADYLEVDRSGLSAELGKLRREGVLECRKNEFHLLRGRE